MQSTGCAKLAHMSTHTQTRQAPCSSSFSPPISITRLKYTRSRQVSSRYVRKRRAVCGACSLGDAVHAVVDRVVARADEELRRLVGVDVLEEARARSVPAPLRHVCT